jgi:hypothetical protein
VRQPRDTRLRGDGSGKNSTRLMNPNHGPLIRIDTRFNRYFEKVLERIPDEISAKFLSSRDLAVVSFDFKRVGAVFLRLDRAVKDIILLDQSILGRPEAEIVEYIAHELAHWLVGGGESGLHEMEAEALAEQWGYGGGDYPPAIEQRVGFEVGYRWAKKSKLSILRDRFERFLAKWDEGLLGGDDWREMSEEVDIPSILQGIDAWTVRELARIYNRGLFDTLEKAIQHPEVLDVARRKLVENIASSSNGGRGIVSGIMAFLREALRDRSDAELQSKRQDLYKQAARINDLLDAFMCRSGFDEWLEEGVRHDLNRLRDTVRLVRERLRA